MREDIINIIAQSLGVEIEDVDEAKRLREDLGLDESELSQILEVIKNKYNLTLSEDDLGNINTVSDLLELSESQQP